jgi:hypothetical protein
LKWGGEIVEELAALQGVRSPGESREVPGYRREVLLWFRQHASQTHICNLARPIHGRSIAERRRTSFPSLCNVQVWRLVRFRPATSRPWTRIASLDGLDRSKLCDHVAAFCHEAPRRCAAVWCCDTAPRHLATVPPRRVPRDQGRLRLRGRAGGTTVTLDSLSSEPLPSNRNGLEGVKSLLCSPAVSRGRADPPSHPELRQCMHTLP